MKTKAGELHIQKIYVWWIEENDLMLLASNISSIRTIRSLDSLSNADFIRKKYVNRLWNEKAVLIIADLMNWCRFSGYYSYYARKLMRQNFEILLKILVALRDIIFRLSNAEEFFFSPRRKVPSSRVTLYIFFRGKGLEHYVVCLLAS